MHVISGLLFSQKWKTSKNMTMEVSKVMSIEEGNIYIFRCLDIFGLMKFCENVSILNTKPIKFSTTTSIPFSKKYRKERHKRIKRHSVPESVK